MQRGASWGSKSKAGGGKKSKAMKLYTPLKVRPFSPHNLKPFICLCPFQALFTTFYPQIRHFTPQFRPLGTQIKSSRPYIYPVWNHRSLALTS